MSDAEVVRSQLALKVMGCYVVAAETAAEPVVAVAAGAVVSAEARTMGLLAS